MGAISYTLKGEESRLQPVDVRNSGRKIRPHHTTTDLLGLPQVQTEQTEARSRGIPWEYDRGEGQLQYETAVRGRECDCGLVGEVMST